MVNRPLKDRHALPALAAGAHPHQAPQDEIPAGLETSVRDPIPLPRGRQLVTLEDAGNYIMKLPKAEHEAAEWQARDGSLDPGRDVGRPDDVCADRRYEGVEPERRADV
jgi:hypothetical protein